MGFLSNLFGKKPQVEPTAEMMDEDRYWKLVDDSLRAAEVVAISVIVDDNLERHST